MGLMQLHFSGFHPAVNVLASMRHLLSEWGMDSSLSAEKRSGFKLKDRGVHQQWPVSVGQRRREMITSASHQKSETWTLVGYLDHDEIIQQLLEIGKFLSL